MSYAHMLAVLSGAADDPETLAIAADLAKQHGAVVRALIVVPRVVPGMWGELYGAGFLAPEVWDAVMAGEHELKRKTEELVRGAADRLGLDHGEGPGGARMLTAPDAPTLWIGLLRELPLTDLVVAGYSYAKEDGPFSGILDAALMDCRAPVLIVRGSRPLRDRPAAIAWDGSLQAGRAARAAVPLLQHASGVVILQDPERLDADERGWADPQRLSDYLKLHGVGPVSVKKIMSGWPGLGLAQTAADEEAGLLVAGAYGHARLQEALFGGATRVLLADAEGPHLLLVH